MRSEPTVERTNIHDVILIQSHMYFDTESNDLRFGFQLWHCFPHGPDSPQEGPSLGQLEPHGSWGFLPKGETACTLRGNWWMSSRKNGKRTAGTPDGTCGQPGRGDYSLDPWWFSSTRPGGSLFLRHMMPGGLAVPRTGDSSAGGSTRPDWSGTTTCCREKMRRKISKKEKKRKARKNLRVVGEYNLFQPKRLEWY